MPANRYALEAPYTVREEPLDEEDPNYLWSNPDVPPVEDVLDGRVTEFECPYPDKNCGPVVFEIESDNPREAFIEALKDMNGTARCEDCEEPIYGIRGGGDH